MGRVKVPPPCAPRYRGVPVKFPCPVQAPLFEPTVFRQTSRTGDRRANLGTDLAGTDPWSQNPGTRRTPFTKPRHTDSFTKPRHTDPLHQTLAHGPPSQNPAHGLLHKTPAQRPPSPNPGTRTPFTKPRHTDPLHKTPAHGPLSQSPDPRHRAPSKIPGRNADRRTDDADPPGTAMRRFAHLQKPGGRQLGGGNKSENAGKTSVDRSTKATLTLTVPGSK
jgi:hypothetical protein